LLCESFIVPSSWWSPHSSLPRGKLLNCCFVGKQNSGPLLVCPVFVFFRKLQALQLHCKGQSRLSALFHDLRRKSSVKRRLMVLLLILEPVSPSSARIYLTEHEGDFTTHLFIKISSRRVVFRGRPLLLQSE